MPNPSETKPHAGDASRGIRVVGFDCDGVMFDSAQANRTYYNAILAHCRHPRMTPRQFAYAQMHTADESVAHLFPEPDEYAQAQAFRRTMSYLPFIRHMQIEPHLQALLDKLRPSYWTAVATNRTDTMDHVLAEHGLEGCFDLVVSARDVARPKPHPDSLMRVLEHFEVDADQMIYIGDSELDARAAASAGVRFVAFRNPDLDAGHHVSSLRDMEAILGL